MYNVVAVVVTYNRLQLLMEAVAAVKAQTYSIKKIIVVDNGSTDGTGGWLAKEKGITVKHQQNFGGSGGFYTGIKMAVYENADFIWVMDDDTICEENALKKLTDNIEKINGPLGFIGSKCLWMDGSPHLMNIPPMQPVINKIPFNKYDEHRILLTATSSFVSLLINAEAVKKVGLPYKEFFIWGDDQEYTSRLTSAGYLGFYCSDSIAVHKTPTNYFPDFYRDSLNNIWKHKYGLRNEFFMIKKNKGFLFFIFWLPIKVAYTSLKILKIRKTHQLKFIGVLLSSAWKSIFFNPSIDMIPYQIFRKF